LALRKNNGRRPHVPNKKGNNFSGSGTNQKKMDSCQEEKRVCKFFLQKRCTRGQWCDFRHPADANLESSMSAMSLGSNSNDYKSQQPHNGSGPGGSSSTSSWRQPPPNAQQQETPTGPDLINTLPDSVLAKIFEELGANYIYLSRLALVCRKWQRISESDELCGAWRLAAESYYLYQGGAVKKAHGSWKNFFGLMINCEGDMMDDAFDEFDLPNEQQQYDEDDAEGGFPYDLQPHPEGEYQWDDGAGHYGYEEGTYDPAIVQQGGEQAYYYPPYYNPPTYYPPPH